MKIIIGITQEPAQIKGLIARQYGETGAYTEVGPFLTKKEAVKWIEYLKNLIEDIEEIAPDQQASEDGIWYGFTYEQADTLFSHK